MTSQRRSSELNGRHLSRLREVPHAHAPPLLRPARESEFSGAGESDLTGVGYRHFDGFAGRRDRQAGPLAEAFHALQRTLYICIRLRTVPPLHGLLAGGGSAAVLRF